MLILWLEETILQIYKPEKRTELQNIDSSTWDITFNDYCVSCSSPIKNTESLDQLEWLLGLAIRKTYNAQSKKLLYAIFFRKIIFKVIVTPFVIFQKKNLILKQKRHLKFLLMFQGLYYLIIQLIILMVIS